MRREGFVVGDGGVVFVSISSTTTAHHRNLPTHRLQVRHRHRHHPRPVSLKLLDGSRQS